MSEPGTVDGRLPAWPQVDGLHLVLSSLGSVLVDEAGVRSVRAQDASGGFGLWPGHADLLSLLGVGVLSWRDAQQHWHYCAVSGGVLTLQRGCELQVATREAVLGEDLDHLEHQVLARLREREQVEQAARRQSRHLEVQVLRELIRPLQRRPQVPWSTP